MFNNEVVEKLYPYATSVYTATVDSPDKTTHQEAYELFLGSDPNELRKLWLNTLCELWYMGEIQAIHNYIAKIAETLEARAVSSWQIGALPVIIAALLTDLQEGLAIADVAPFWELVDFMVAP